MDKNLKKFKNDGKTLHFMKSGSGQPLIFIPGSISDYRTWENISAKLSDAYECYVISRRFQFPDTFISGGDGSVAANTADIAAFIKEFDLSPAMVVGHSYGGFIALNLAIEHPELVSKVVAEESIFAPVLAKNPKNPLELIGLMFKNFKAGKSFARLGIKGIDPTFKALSKGDIESAKISFIDGVTAGKKTPATLDVLTKQQLEDNIASLAGEDPFNNKIKLSDLEKITSKVLLISGTESPYVFQYINEILNKKIPHAQLIIFNGASHWIHIEEANGYAKAIRNFLKN